MDTSIQRYGLAAAAVAVSLCAAATPVVDPSSVRASQDDFRRTVTIEYQLSGEPGIVTVDIQTNVTGDVWASIGGEHYQGMYGAVNCVNTNTTTKSYVWWHPDKDWGDASPRLYNVRAVVTAWSTNSPPNYMAVDLTSMSNFLFYASAESVPGGVTNRKYKTDWLLMRKIPARGVVWRMGSPSDESTAKSEPDRLVYLTDDYYIGVYELTQKQYWNISDGASGSSPSVHGVDAGGDAEIRPLENIAIASLRGQSSLGGTYSWPEHGHDVVSSSSDPKFYRLSYLRIKTGLMFDMPTSAQWEYACRAGTPGKFNDGSDSISAVGWYSGNWSEDTAISSNMTHEVGLKTSNRWGLYDMHGNVSEYVLERYYYPEADDGVTYVNPTIPAGHGYTDGYSTYRHIVRGGSFSESAANCRSAVCTAAQSGSSSRGYRLWLPAGIPHYGKPAAFK